MGDAAAEALPLQARHIVEERSLAGPLAEAEGFVADAFVLDVFQDFRPGDAVSDMAIDIDDEIILQAAIGALFAAMRQDVIGVGALDDRRQFGRLRALYGHAVLLGLLGRRRYVKRGARLRRNADGSPT